MPIAKFNGEQFRSTITFSHIGEGGAFDVGIALKYTPSPTWAFTRISIPDTDETLHYTVDVSGTFSTDLGGDRRIDVLKFIQQAGGPRDISGDGFEISDWDREVYVVGVDAQFSDLNAMYW